MTSAEATLLAAIISGAVIALTFLAAEIIKIVSERHARQDAAVLALLKDLEQVPQQVLDDRIFWIPAVWKLFTKPSMGRWLSLSSTATSLYGVFRGRDRVIADWAVWRVDRLLETKGDMAKIVQATEFRGILTLVLASRRKARAYVSRPNREFQAWLENVDLNHGRTEP